MELCVPHIVEDAFLSNFLTGRDANRGGCSQICRWDFDLYEGDNHLEGDKPFTLLYQRFVDGGIYPRPYKNWS